MLKETGYQEKFEILHPWLVEIIEGVKKDLKSEHLKIDREFCKKYFLGKNPSQIHGKEMAPAYAKDIAAGNVGLGEFIASRWLLKNTDIYGYFEERLKELTPDFEGLELLDRALSEKLMGESIQLFGAMRTYLFSVLNSVVFPEEVYAELRQRAEKEAQEGREKKEAALLAETLEAMQQRHNREMAALTDRYEKKLSGLQRKYLNDMEKLKKQVSTLQKKLNHG